LFFYAKALESNDYLSIYPANFEILLKKLSKKMPRSFDKALNASKL